jgi:hypothetical protein
MRGSWWIFVEVTTTVASMASLTVNREANIGLRVSETSMVSSAEDPRDRRIAKKPSKLQNNLSRLGDINLLLGQSGKVSPSSIGKSAAKRSRWRQYNLAEFVETVRKSSEQARRPFTISEIQRAPVAMASNAMKITPSSRQRSRLGTCVFMGG